MPSIISENHGKNMKIHQKSLDLMKKTEENHGNPPRNQGSPPKTKENHEKPPENYEHPPKTMENLHQPLKPWITIKTKQKL